MGARGIEAAGPVPAVGSSLQYVCDLEVRPGAWDRPRSLLSLRPHPTMPLRLRRPLARSCTVGSERFVRVVRQGVPNRAQRKDLHGAQEIPRDDETRWRPAHQSLSSRRRPPADHPDGPPHVDLLGRIKETPAGTGPAASRLEPASRPLRPQAFRDRPEGTPAASTPELLLPSNESERIVDELPEIGRRYVGRLDPRYRPAPLGDVRTMSTPV